MPISGIYPLLETILQSKEVACVLVTLPIGSIETVEIIHLVSRPESGKSLVAADPSDPLARPEPWKLTVVGPEELAAKVRGALASGKGVLAPYHR